MKMMVVVVVVVVLVVMMVVMTSFVDLNNIYISLEVLETLTSQDWVAVAIDGPQHLWILISIKSDTRE